MFSIYSEFHGSETMFSGGVDPRHKYATLQSHHFRSEADYETIKQIHSNINRIVSTYSRYFLE